MVLVRNWGKKALIAAMAAMMIPASVAVPRNVNGGAGTALVSLFGASEAKADHRRHHRQWRGDGRWDRGPHWRGDRRWDRGRYYRRHRNNDAAAAVIGGIVGLGLGAAIANSNQPRYVQPAPRYVQPSYAPEPWTREWYRYCSQRYRSFDPGSGTFQPYNGPRRMCR